MTGNDILFFCGIKHCGKSTLGKLVARQLGYNWADLDDLVLKEISGYQSIRSFYREQGQLAFQREEYKALQQFLSHTQGPSLVSLGGGACDNAKLVQLAKQYGRLIYLYVEEGVLLERILKGGVPPFLDSNDPKGSFSDLYTQRDERYRNICDFMVRLPDYPDIRETARFLVEMLVHED